MSDPRQSIGDANVPQNEPLSWRVTILGPSGAIDLTTFGSSWAGNLRQSTTMVPAIAFGIDATNAATGVLVLSLTGTQTAGMATAPNGAATKWFFDLTVTGGAVTPQTPFQGTVTVWPVYT